jgi:predicted ATPase/class 3 adenylate cyclase
MAGELPTGTVTFMFTDIEGSTPLWDAHPGHMDAALRRHDELVRAAIGGSGGRVFSTGGDGFGAVFSRAADAVNAAVEVQRCLGSEAWPEPVELRVRIGLHTGEAHERDGDYFGPPVNRAARLMGAANGGQSVMSALTAGLITATAGVGVIDLGSVQLKGVVEAVHVFGIDAADAPWVDLPLVSTQPTAGNLPRLQTEMVGDLAGLQHQVGRLASTRTVTLTGSGGVGKTRAAIEIGWLVIDEFIDGVWFIELAAIADPESVFGAIADQLGVAPQPGVALEESIVEWCKGRRTLLIIDNCEHVLDPIALLVTRIIAQCATVSIVSTSREPLGVQGEHVIRIPSLNRLEGVELFELRASTADTSFDPAPGESEVIAAICERLDGIPLAIELAAARVTSLTPTELLDRLDDRFRLLRGSGRGGLERHQTIRATITWSYQLLSEAERSLFARLSVFAGGFDLEAAETITHGGDIDRYDVVDLLGELVDKSMVTADRTELGTRYQLLEMLRQYGEERLDDGGEMASARDRHLDYYGNVAERFSREWEGSSQLDALAGYRYAWDNFRAAHAWSCATSNPASAQTIVVATAPYAVHGLIIEHSDWTNRTVAQLDIPDDGTARVFGVAAAWALLNARIEDCLALSERGLEVATDPDGLASCRTFRLYGLALTGRADETRKGISDVQNSVESHARPYLRWIAARALVDVTSGAAEALAQFVQISEHIGGPIFLVDARFAQCDAALFNDGDAARAIEYFNESAEIGLEVGAELQTTVSMGTAALAIAIRSTPDAGEQIRELLSQTYAARSWTAVVAALGACTIHLLNESSLANAATIAGFLDDQEMQFDGYDQLLQRGIASSGGLTGFDAQRTTGREMNWDQIVAFALDQLTVAAP